jgi:hypothetical protein
MVGAYDVIGAGFLCGVNHDPTIVGNMPTNLGEVHPSPVILVILWVIDFVLTPGPLAGIEITQPFLESPSVHEGWGEGDPQGKGTAMEFDNTHAIPAVVLFPDQGALGQTLELAHVEERGAMDGSGGHGEREMSESKNF